MGSGSGGSLGRGLKQRQIVVTPLDKDSLISRDIGVNSKNITRVNSTSPQDEKKAPARTLFIWPAPVSGTKQASEMLLAAALEDAARAPAASSSAVEEGAPWRRDSSPAANPVFTWVCARRGGNWGAVLEAG